MEGTVQVVLLNSEGLVLGVSRKTDHNDFGLIGGSLESYDLTPEDGAIRETKEETGLDISNLKLIYVKVTRDGRIGYTYLADYSGEISHDEEKEPHIVKWTTFSELIRGSFGHWNLQVYQSLVNLGIDVK
jgi:8-oxo-dGTP pyrophosphatase MutT (NUDIX family)